jgi:hypothetical protein
LNAESSRWYEHRRKSKGVNHGNDPTKGREGKAGCEIYFRGAAGRSFTIKTEAHSGGMPKIQYVAAGRGGPGLLLQGRKNGIALAQDESPACRLLKNVSSLLEVERVRTVQLSIKIPGEAEEKVKHQDGTEGASENRGPEAIHFLM